MRGRRSHARRWLEASGPHTPASQFLGCISVVCLGGRRSHARRWLEASDPHTTEMHPGRDRQAGWPRWPRTTQLAAMALRSKRPTQLAAVAQLSNATQLSNSGDR